VARDMIRARPRPATTGRRDLSIPRRGSGKIPISSDLRSIHHFQMKWLTQSAPYRRAHGNRRTRGVRCAVAVCLAAILVPGAVATAEPLHARNLAPVSGLIGFPAMRDAHVLDRGRFSVELHGSLASSYGEHAKGDEAIILDGETAGLTGRWAYGLGDGWEVEAEMSWRRHSGGFLDRWIEDWHDLWGLPDGGRPEAPRDRIEYRYRGPQTRFLVQEPASGLSNLHLAAVREMGRSDNAALSIRTGVRLGIADEDRLLGGGDDFYVSINATGASASLRGLVWHAQLGWLRAGKLRILGAMQRRNPWFASVGAEWPVWRALTVKAQVDAHAPIAHSALTELGSVALLLTLGATWAISPELDLEFGFSEDLAPHTGPDFTPRAGIRYVPAAR